MVAFSWYAQMQTRRHSIYYYTPLPLNLANKQQQASNKQALLLSVLAIARPHRSGLYSTLAILEPSWWPCQIQVLSQKLTGGAPGRGRQVGRCPPKSAQLWAKKQPFFAQKSPQTRAKRPNQGKRWLHSTCGLTSPCQRALSCPSTPHMSDKRPKKAPKSHKICAMYTNTPKPSTGCILGYVAQKPIPRAPSPPANPHFVWFPSPRIAQRDA